MQRHCVEGDLGSALQGVGWVRDRIPVVFSHFSCITGLSVQTWAKPWEGASTCSYSLWEAPFYTKPWLFPHAGLSALPYCTSESTEWRCPVRLENAMKLLSGQGFYSASLGIKVLCVRDLPWAYFVWLGGLPGLQAALLEVQRLGQPSIWALLWSQAPQPQEGRLM